MDWFQMVIGAVGAVFGAGSTYGVMTQRVKQVETDVDKLEKGFVQHRENTEDKLDKIDTKIDNLTNHIISLAQRPK